MYSSTSKGIFLCIPLHIRTLYKISDFTCFKCESHFELNLFFS